MRQLYTLQQTLQKKPNYSVIVLNAVDLCKAAESAVLSIHETQASGRSKASDTLKEPEPNPISVLYALELAYEVLCQGLNKLASSAEGRKHEGHLVYHLVSLFETILRALEQRSKATAKLEEENSAQRRQTKKQKQQATKSNKQAKTSTTKPDEDEVSQGIVRLLAAMMLSGSSNSVATATTHQDLLEGYLFVLLSRVGKILCLFEFRDLLLRPDLRAAPDKLPMPQGLLQAEFTDDASIRAAEMEAKYLAWLLERAMAVVYSFFMKSSTSSNANSNGTVNEDGPNEPLLRFAKRKLQSTLLKAVFGDEHPAFVESLKRPRLLPEALARPCRAAEESALEWFPREVWRLLGWDMLAEDHFFQ